MSVRNKQKKFHPANGGAVFGRKSIKAIAFICFAILLFWAGNLSFAITVEEKYYFAARDKIFKNDFAGAKATLEKYNKIDPEQQTIIIYTKILNDLLMKKIKKETGLFIFRAIEYIRVDKLNEAMLELNYALKINSKCSWIFNFRGLIYTAQQYYDRAKSEFDRAIELNKNELEFYFNRSVIFIYQGNIEAAVNDLNFVVNKNKKYRYCKALFRKAYLSESLGNIEEALSAYKKFVTYGETKTDVFLRERINKLHGMATYDADLIEYAKWRKRELRKRLEEIAAESSE